MLNLILKPHIGIVHCILCFYWTVLPVPVYFVFKFTLSFKYLFIWLLVNDIIKFQISKKWIFYSLNLSE